VAGRTGAAVTGWLGARGQAWKDTVAVVAVDPCAAYRTAITRALPHAVIAVDHFHRARLASQAVTRVCQRVTREHLGRRGTRRDPAWANRRRLLRARERLSERSFTAMWNQITDHEPPRSCSPHGPPNWLIRLARSGCRQPVCGWKCGCPPPNPP
jgi:transposase